MQSPALSSGWGFGLGRLTGLGVLLMKVGVTLMVSRVAEDFPVDSPTPLKAPPVVE